MGTFPITRRNLGTVKSNVMPGLFKGVIFTNQSFSLSSTNKVLQAQWQNALLDTPANRIHLAPRFREFTDSSEKPIYDKTDLSTMFVRPGRREFDVLMKENFFIHQALQTYSGNIVGKVIFVDSNNYLWGQVDATGTFSGYTSELVNSEPLMLNDGKKSAGSPVKIVLSDTTEIDILGGYVNAQSFFGKLKELIDVDITQVGSGTTSLFKVTVTGTGDSNSLDGLVAADFTVKSSAGVSRTISGVTEDLTVVPGVYSIASSAAFTVGDIVQLVAANTLSIPGYESTGGIVTV